MYTQNTTGVVAFKRKKHMTLEDKKECQSYYTRIKRYLKNIFDQLRVETLR